MNWVKMKTVCSGTNRQVEWSAKRMDPVKLEARNTEQISVLHFPLGDG